MAISRSPLEWDRFDVTLTQYTAAWLRVFVLAFIAFIVFSPNLSKSTGIGIFRGLGAGYVILATRSHLLFRRFETWRYERAQVKALRNADRAAYEADQAAQQAEVARKAAAVTPETVSSTDAATNPVTSSANGESAAGIGSGDTNSEPTKMVERLPGSPASPITVAYPSPGEVEAAEETAAPLPDYSAAQRYPWHLPNPEMLAIAKPGGITQDEIDNTSRRIEESLGQFGIDVSVDQVRQGPTVTMYGLSPGWKGRSEENTGQRVRVDTILNREKDIALALASPSLRFEAPVPGESVVGIEVPNTSPTQVTLRSVMDTPEWDRFIETAALPGGSRPPAL